MIIDNKELIISPASFEDAIDLKDCIEKAIQDGKLKLNIEDVQIESLEDIKVDPETLTSLINSILSIDSSKKVRELIFKCAQTAVFNKEKVNKDFFEKVENRQYYYPIMFNVALENLAPFFKGLFSKLSGMDFPTMIKNILKLK